jgi:Collagen triple helix repeat (20 copies)
VLLKIRKRLTYANVAMTLALVFAMSGGAYAASKYVITSTKQISPKVLKALAGKPGKTGSSGAQGPAGPAGPQGSAGTAGLKGEKGEKGERGEKGETGQNGFTETLPSGKTEKGTWVNFHTATVAHEFSGSPISFTIPLAKGLNEQQVHYFKAGEKGDGKGCPATSEAAKPEAEPGNLCVFAVMEGNVKPIEGLGKLFTIRNPEAEESEEPSMHSGKAGTLVLSESIEPGEMSAYGTWAVTAP